MTGGNERRGGTKSRQNLAEQTDRHQRHMRPIDPKWPLPPHLHPALACASVRRRDGNSGEDRVLCGTRLSAAEGGGGDDVIHHVCIGISAAVARTAAL